MQQIIHRAILRVAAAAGFTGCDETAYSLGYCQGSYAAFGGEVADPTFLINELLPVESRGCIHAVFAPHHEEPAKIQVSLKTRGWMSIEVVDGTSLDEPEEESGHDHLHRHQAREVLPEFERLLSSHAADTATRAMHAAYKVTEACDPTWWAGDVGDTIYANHSRYLLLRRYTIGSISLEIRLHELPDHFAFEDETEVDEFITRIYDEDTVHGSVSCHVFRHDVEIASSPNYFFESTSKGWRTDSDFKACLRDAIDEAVHEARQNIPAASSREKPAILQTINS